MTTKMISEETLQPQAQEETRITPRDLRRVFWRSFQMEFSWNYERQMNLAFVYALIPVLKKLYPRREELAAALKRHLVFFNTTPHIVTLLLGSTTAMEEKNSQQKNMDATAIDNVKASLMGPLAGLVTLFLGRCASSPPGSAPAGAEGQHPRPILFLLVLTCRTFWCAGVLPAGATYWAPGPAADPEERNDGEPDLRASIIGLMVVGAMTASMIDITIPLLRRREAKPDRTLSTTFCPACCRW
ncbi:PTS system mannose/fructose/sorbose family transporter subunit IID [Klebsiella pneumoniae]